MQTTSHALFKMTTVCLNASFQSCYNCHWSMMHHALALLELTPFLNQLHSQIDFFAFH